MRIVATGYGSPSTMLREVRDEDRSPAAGEIAIDVRAAAVNPKDVKLYADKEYARARDQGTEFPLQLGLEAAGVVTAVGPGASGPLGPIQVGDEVVAYRIEGAYASRILVPASAVVLKPRRLSWAQAGSMSLTGTTALHCLAAVLARPSETILVHAAAGAVGRCVVQLAIIAGAKVIGTASEKDFNTLRAFGATPVAYGKGLQQRVRAAAPGGVVAAVDTAGTDEAIDVSLALVPDRSRIATIVSFERAKRDGFQALGGESGNDEGIKIRDNARYIIAALAQSGALEVHVDRCFPLARAAEAHELMLKGGAGRLVLTP